VAKVSPTVGKLGKSGEAAELSPALSRNCEPCWWSGQTTVGLTTGEPTGEPEHRPSPM